MWYGSQRREGSTSDKAKRIKQEATLQAKEAAFKEEKVWLREEAKLIKLIAKEENAQLREEAKLIKLKAKEEKVWLREEANWLY